MRLLVRLLSMVLGLALAAAGALLTAELAWAWWQPERGSLLLPWRDWLAELTEQSWNTTAVRIVAGCVVALGLLLLLVATSAGRRDVRLSSPAPEVTVTTSPRSLARLVGTRVRAADGVTGATVTASSKRVSVRATSRLQDEAQLRPQLLELTKTVVGGLPLPRTPKVNVVVDSPKDR